MPDPREATAAEKERINRYLKLMVELSVRIDLVSEATAGRLNLTPPYAREFCYFQFRRICEIMALGCLILHGDIPATQSKNARTQWNAEKIMGLLDQLHENFFPQAVTPTTDSDGTITLNANTVEGALTKQEFKQLYHECAVVLHRGSIKSLELEKTPSSEDYKRVFTWADKIVALMQQHIVWRPLASGFYDVLMKTEKGGPQCSLLIFSDGKFSVHTVSVKFSTESH